LLVIKFWSGFALFVLYPFKQTPEPGFLLNE